MNSTKRKIGGRWWWSLLLISQLAQAQFIGFPVGPNFSNTLQRNARTTAASLPFFDDFSLSSNGRLNPALWQNGGGTYVNNTLTVNHPTLNVVTFDGTNAAGKPYNFTNQNAYGSTDTLTSQPIDLTGLAPADSVYLSFYWQIRGLGELPDAEDSLQLQFRTAQGVWQTIWKQAGGTPNLNFNYAYLALKSTAYLYDTFQFRFRAFGRQSGMFDTWHIDYVYLNKKRTTADRFVRDIACRVPVSSLLKRYSAMPIKQYMARPAAETADSVYTDIRNLNGNFMNDGGGFNQITFTYTLANAQTGSTIQTINKDTAVIIRALSSQIKSVKPRPLLLPDTAKRVLLTSKFRMLTTDNVTPSIVGIDLRRNDTISGVTVLDNYYAYDDGSAEYAVYLNRPLGRAAVRYVLNRPDSVSAIRINLVPILKDLTDQSITVQVWSNKNGRPNALLGQKSARVQYAANRNDFVEFPLDFGVAVSDTFYVGWLQIGQESIAVGLDRNNRREEQIYVNLGQDWQPYTNSRNDPTLAFFNGSLLVRPVMGGKRTALVTAVSPEETPDWQVYPNPTDGLVRWEADDIKQVEVWNSGGVLVRQWIQSSEKQINLTDFPDGLYLMRLSNEKKSLVKKILLRK